MRGFSTTWEWGILGAAPSGTEVIRLGPVLRKQDVINEVATKTGLTKVQASDAVEAFVGTIESTLSQGGSVQLTGFGTFEVRHRKARRGRAFAGGGTVEIPEQDVPAFRPGRTLKNAVR